MIYDVLTTFGELTDEAVQNRKYAKWKAAYIHNCLKNGETPVPGELDFLHYVIMRIFTGMPLNFMVFYQKSIIFIFLTTIYKSIAKINFIIKYVFPILNLVCQFYFP